MGYFIVIIWTTVLLGSMSDYKMAFVAGCAMAAFMRIVIAIGQPEGE